MKTLITTHKAMDLDSLGAVIAAKKLYPESLIVLPGTKGKDVMKVLEENPDIIEYVEDSDLKSEDFDQIVIVDTVDIERLPESVKSIIFKSKPKIVFYDHHGKEVEIKGLNVELHFKPCGAVTSILTLLIKGKTLVPSPLEASVMALGIYSDTGNFLFPNVTSMDFIAASYLFSIGASVEFIKRYLPKELSEVEIDVLKSLKDNVEILDIGGNRIAITVAQFDTYVGDVAHLVSKLLEINNFPAVIAIVGVEGTVFVIGRSRTSKVDVSKVASVFGGGGHKEAASAVVRGRTVHEVREDVVKVLKDIVEPVKLAMDIMTSPAKVVFEFWDVKKTLDFLVKNGLNAAPVVDKEGKLVGIVSRKLTDKAIYMGMHDEKVKAIVQTDISFVYPEDSVEKVEDIIVNKHQAFVPVINRNGKVLGVITRTDILMNLYRKDLEESESFYAKRVQGYPHVKNVKQLLYERIPECVLKILRTIGKVADSEGVNAYIVGGFVRDLIIGRENLDVDIVVEGDATEFAKKVAKRLNAKVHTFDRFKTAIVVMQNGFKIDMASARTEVYSSPGALPSIDIAPLKKDLFRRDFTINTLAIKLNEKEFGKLIDYFNGLKDIKEKKIRVIHSLSFIEDPTRILRALRFAVRYRFELGKHTEKLLKIAVQRKLFKTVEGRRLYLELKHIFEEDNPLRIVNRMNEYGVLKVLCPEINWNRSKKDLFESIRKMVIWHKVAFERKLNYPLLYFAALLEGLPYQKVEEFLESLSPPVAEKELIMKIFIKSRQVLGRIHKNLKNSQILELLEGLPEEVVLYMAAKAKDGWKKGKILQFLKEWRFLKPSITGNDLKKLGIKPGPIYREILREVRNRVVDGELLNREEQVKFILDKFLKKESKAAL